MCGFAGYLVASGSVPGDTLKAWVEKATMRMRHRGPDGTGLWLDVGAGFGVGHRRLSIIDLSSLGHQPMKSADERWIISYNGELYNFPLMRRELEESGICFRGNSDTEVLLEAIALWGVADTLKRANGMFAFAVWDQKSRTLYLARDRFGQKPLYYGWVNKNFIFGSELSSLRKFPGVSESPDLGSIGLYLRHNAIPAPYTIYKNYWKLMPGTYLELNYGLLASEGIPEPKRFWSTFGSALKASGNPLKIGQQAAVEALDDVLRKAVAQCMVSDTSLGAFLSGGIDSSTVVALMQQQSSSPVRTFSIGFDEEGYDESQYARDIATHLKTDHTELRLSPQDAQSIITDLPTIYDEPFADSSQIPTYLVSRLAREHVTVVLSGDGGDELFGGYNRYVWGRRLKMAIECSPTLFRRLLSRSCLAVPPSTWDGLYRRISGPTGGKPKETQIGDKLHKLAEIIGAASCEEMYLLLVSQWKMPSDVLLDGLEHQTCLSNPSSWPGFSSFEQQMMLLDTVSYLPDDILVKLDRASMFVSLEARVPLLDHKVFEFAWSLPMNMKIENGQGKSILRQVLQKYVPRELFDRPKMGFGVPIGDWLRGGLREWAEDLLSAEMLRRQNYFNVEVVRNVWETHLRGQRNNQYMLWPILMFQCWLEYSE